MPLSPGVSPKLHQSIPSDLYWSSAIGILLLITNFAIEGFGFAPIAATSILAVFLFVFKQKLDRKIQARQSQIDLILETSPIGIALTVDENEKSRHLNQKFYELLENEKNGESISDLISKIQTEDEVEYFKSDNHYPAKAQVWTKKIERSGSPTRWLEVSKHKTTNIKDSHHLDDPHSFRHNLSD